MMRQETIDMEVMVTERLRAYMFRTKKLPGKMTFFRDGVSKSQYDQGCATKTEGIRRAYLELSKGV